MGKPMKELRFGQTRNPDPKSFPKQVPVCYKCLHDYLTRKLLTWKYLIYFGGVPGVSDYFFGGRGVRVQAYVSRTNENTP